MSYKVQLSGDWVDMTRFSLYLASAVGIPSEYFETHESATRASIAEARVQWEFKLQNKMAFFSLMITLGMMTPRRVIEHMYPQAKQYRKN